MNVLVTDNTVRLMRLLIRSVTDMIRWLRSVHRISIMCVVWRRNSSNITTEARFAEKHQLQQTFFLTMGNLLILRQMTIFNENILERNPEIISLPIFRFSKEDKRPYLPMPIGPHCRQTIPCDLFSLNEFWIIIIYINFFIIQ